MQTLPWQVVLLLAVALVLALAVGAVVGAALARAGARAGLVRAEAERDGWARQAQGLEDALAQERGSAAQLAPLGQALRRVEEQVHVLERDRSRQFGEVGVQLADVAEQARALHRQTAALSGALNSSGTRGTWGEVQLRRVLEHAGMLERCDFDEQVSAVTRHDARVRPDAVVHLPGGKSLVVDSKAPLTAYLRAQGEDVPAEEAARLLRDHARALRGHVETLAGKDYWSAFASSPELVVCFVPSDSVLAAALRAEPDLYDHAQSRRVVLASPATLLAVLRATALAWQQEALTANAQQLLRLGTELHQRLGTVGRHLGSMGSSLRRSVETYNHLVGTLESRVLVTTRRMHELGLVEEAVEAPPPVDASPRPLTSAELLADELESATPRRDDLDEAAARRTRSADAVPRQDEPFGA
ncbi:DNA recombination protein RmuC [Ornithinimicrobium avium]|uniref:DNA recombination protein RmuC n=1 Tax=Ornithinimicrobium avium TaxID=2283195 RepID=A0A345NRF0_9MICO|nr:DNA recombination protein RmuC [Ornithinimicrobium avium]AXH97608.1 DNA recombination protein RmuC [Ornithinimicrobium avium]